MPDPPSTARVLLVEDEPAIRATLAEALHLFLGPGAEVRAAASAEEALRALQEGPFGLVLADHRLPGRTGLELLRHIHAAHPAMRRLLMTAYADPGLERMALREGHAEAFLQKPFEPEVLERLVLDLLAGSMPRAGSASPRVASA